MLTSDTTYADVEILVFIPTKRDFEGMIERMSFTLGPNPRYPVRTGSRTSIDSLGVGAEPARGQRAGAFHDTGQFVSRAVIADSSATPSDRDRDGSG